jgi:hypothetical protein
MSAFPLENRGKIWETSVKSRASNRARDFTNKAEVPTITPRHLALLMTAGPPAQDFHEAFVRGAAG